MPDEIQIEDCIMLIHVDCGGIAVCHFQICSAPNAVGALGQTISATTRAQLVTDPKNERYRFKLMQNALECFADAVGSEISGGRYPAGTPMPS